MNMDRGLLTESVTTLLSTEHIQRGDLLLFRGSDAVSRAIRELDRGVYDHCALVIETAGDQPVLVDQNFRGFSQWRLGAYEAKPEAVLVRRHRIRGHGDLFVRRAMEYGRLYPTYAFGRLANIMLVSLVRSLPAIENFALDSKRRFAQRMGLIFTMALSQTERTDTGVCVSLPLYVFDAIPEAGPARIGPYCGLHLEPHDMGGFGQWFPAVQRFCELIIEHAPEDGSPHPLDQLQLLIDRQLGPNHRSISPGGSGSYSDPGSVDRAAYNIATGLLDRLLRDRFVVTPRDMETTRSLFDVGELDLDSISWIK